MRAKKLLLLLGILTACSLPLVASVFAAPRDVEFRAEAFGDSARIIARWVPTAQGDKGPIDSYAVSWSANAATRAVSRLVPIDTFNVLRPAIGDSVLVSIAVAPVRRGLRGPARTAGTWLKNIDVPPLPVDSIVLDTLAGSPADIADSIAISAFRPSGALIADGDAYIVELDSMLLVNTVYVTAGKLRSAVDTTRWSYSNITEGVVLSLRPVGRWRDSVWVRALNCGCRESGDTANLRYSAHEGKYKYRTPTGGWRDVTPLPFDPFAVAKAL